MPEFSVRSYARGGRPENAAYSESTLPCSPPLVPGDCPWLPFSGLLERLRRVSRAEWRPEPAGRIVFIEVVGSTPETISRHLRRMIGSKCLAGAAGGGWQFVRSGDAEKIDAMLQELAPEFGVPVSRGFPSGHSPECRTVDFSRRVVIKNGELTFP